MKKNFNFNNVGLSKDQALGIWQALRQAVVEIQKGNACKLRFEELYRNAYTLVLHKHGDLVYEGVTECVRQKLHETINIVGRASNENLLGALNEQWDLHKLVMGMVRDILMYMDKTYCRQYKKMSVYDMSLLLFRDNVIRHPSVSPRFRALLQELVRQERTGEAAIDRVLMKNSLAMLVEVNVTTTEVYAKDFEDEFLQQTKSFYQKESQHLIAHLSCPDYLKKIAIRSAEEEARADQYLDKSTKPKLKAAVQHELIVKHAQQLVDDEKSGCVPMFHANQTDDLKLMYTLFSREPRTLCYIRESMSNQMKAIGTKIVQDKNNFKDPRLFVQRVLDTREKFQAFVDHSFNQNREFAKAHKQALEYFINLDARDAQYLSLYVDDMLRKSIRGMTEAEADKKLSDVISIFRYLQDKDIFEDFYKKHLAARLLSSTSADEQIEKIMIQKLKAECGHQFTSRLEGMFKDIKRSQQLIKGYGDWNTRQRRTCDTEMVVTVLTTGFWPVSNSVDINLPPQAQEAAKMFKAYYTNVHSGRRLAWQTSLGTAELKAKFDGGKKELLVSSYQMVILMLYNKGDTFTYKEIQEQTQIPETELPRQLLSLAHPKIKILNKTPNTKKIEASHRFSYNQKYTSNLFRVKVPLLLNRAVSGSKAENEVPAGVMEARKNRVEAAIVRIMKTRKQLDHNNLISEVMKQLSSRFTVELQFVKKRIESLIEREYLERDRTNRRVYHYLA